jgi:2-polyprenyl-3-methyl-5-hydroxy-6-metoxy-1,4-benzoquinol methylase
MNDDYGVGRRDEILPYVAPGIGCLLDVGCAGGGFGESLKQSRPELRVDGVEPSASAALSAADRLDRVFIGEFPAALADADPTHRYDCLTFLDSLEHMVDPWAAVRAAREYLEAEGTVVASIPNVRHVEVLCPLLFRGRFTYASYGLLDTTHLRFFTRSSALRLFEDAGFEVIQCVGLEWSFGSRWYRLASLLGPFGREFRTMQYVIVARLRDSPIADEQRA